MTNETRSKLCKLSFCCGLLPRTAPLPGLANSLHPRCRPREGQGVWVPAFARTTLRDCQALHPLSSQSPPPANIGLLCRRQTSGLQAGVHRCPVARLPPARRWILHRFRDHGAGEGRHKIHRRSPCTRMKPAARPMKRWASTAAGARRSISLSPTPRRCEHRAGTQRIEKRAACVLLFCFCCYRIRNCIPRKDDACA